MVSVALVSTLVCSILYSREHPDRANAAAEATSAALRVIVPPIEKAPPGSSGGVGRGGTTPFKSFGFGFAGDNRGFSTDLNATARITGRIRLGPNGEVSATAWSDPTRCAGPPCSWWYGSRTATASPTISVSQGSGVLTLRLAGANPFVDRAPDIDLAVTLRPGPWRDGLYRGSLSGDGFPNAEVFIVGPYGPARMLHTFQTPGGPLFGPVFKLPGSGGIDMGSF